MKTSDLTSDPMIDAYRQTLEKTARVQNDIGKSKNSKHLNTLFDTLMTELKEISATRDPMRSLLIEQANIVYEKERFSQTPADTARYEKQLTGIHEAIRSLELIRNSEKYQAKVKDTLGIVSTKIPTGEAHNIFIERQNKSLGETKKILEPAFKNWITARQEHLSLTAKMIKQEQAAALGIPTTPPPPPPLRLQDEITPNQATTTPSPRDGMTPDQPKPPTLPDGNVSQNTGDSLLNNQKFLAEQAEQSPYDSALKTYMEANTSQITAMIADNLKAIREQRKNVKNSSGEQLTKQQKVLSQMESQNRKFQSTRKEMRVQIRKAFDTENPELLAAKQIAEKEARQKLVAQKKQNQKKGIKR